MKKILIGGSPCTYWSVAQKPGARETEAQGLGWELFENYLIALEKFKPDEGKNCIAVYDEMLGVKYSKKKSKFKIDGVIAEVIGITGKHVEEGWYNQDINDTHITFYYITDTDANHSDDKNEAEEYYIQVDIWSEEDCFLLKRKIKKLLKKAGFTYFAGNDDYEQDTKIYHKAARFYFLINTEGED